MGVSEYFNEAETAKVIIDDSGDYLLLVKENQNNGKSIFQN